jgi:hypothetical protein
MIAQEKIANLQVLSRQKESLEKEILKQARDTFPIGEHISFYKGRGWINAVVIAHGDCWWVDPSFKIQNINTGKEYWINLYDIIKSVL